MAERDRAAIEELVRRVLLEKLGGNGPRVKKVEVPRLEDVYKRQNEDDSIVYFAHTVSRTGTYLSKTSGVREGEALAYLIAPPLEAVVGLDEAMKAADVELVALFEPPSETNFGGGLLTGTQSACKAACEAFAEAVKAVAARPREV